MPQAMHFYMDDSGPRQPDRKPGRTAAHGYDWYGLGGVLVKEEDEEEARRIHQEFCHKWKITAPLHSVDIRGRGRNFSFVQKMEKGRQDEFYENLYHMMVVPKVIGHGCVIDRPGYNHRYKARYGRQQWSLCKTAFAIAAERAAKFAMAQGRKLKIFLERSDKATERHMEGYFESLRNSGLPFNETTSSVYSPLSAANLRETLYDFEVKHKTSPMIQLADLYLWPMCMGGYHRSNRPYARLLGDNKLMDCLLPVEEVPLRGIKYSCWDLVGVKP